MSSSSTFLASDGDGYELNMGRWSRRLAYRFLEFVGTGEGEHVLDVGCGTGHLAATIAELTTSTRIDGVDLSPEYIEYAKARNPDPRLNFSVGDASALEYHEGTYDRVLSLLVLHFVPRASSAITEMCRVAKRGAIIGAAVWDARGGFVVNRMFFDTAATLNPRANEARARNYTRPLTRPGELAAAWRAAGILDVSETLLHIRMEYERFQDFWAPFLGKDGPGAQYVRSLSATDQQRLEIAMRAAYEDGEPDGPRSYAAAAWAVKGVVPSAQNRAQ